MRFLVILIFAALAASPAAARFYKCQNSEGQLSFSDKPCQAGYEDVTPRAEPRPAPTPAPRPAAVERMDAGQAIAACERHVKSMATHPSTVDYHKILGTSTREFPNGRLAVHSTFTAKNTYGLKLPFRVTCLFEGDQLIDSEIKERG